MKYISQARLILVLYKVHSESLEHLCNTEGFKGPLNWAPIMQGVEYSVEEFAQQKRKKSTAKARQVSVTISYIFLLYLLNTIIYIIIRYWMLA